MDTKLNDDALSEIDRKVNAAKARKANRTGEAPASSPIAGVKAPKSPRKPRVTAEEKAERSAAKVAEQAARKLERTAQRAIKQAVRNAAKPVAHLSKVAKAFNRLPALSQEAQLTVNDVAANFSQEQVAAIAAHLAHFNRAQSTRRALGQKLAAGMQVTIVSGDPRFIGQTGVVVKAQRIRAYVQVDGVNKALYVFTSDVAPVFAESAIAV